MIDSLYELIGGKLTIQAAVDSFYRRVLADETLRPFFGQTEMNHQRARQSMFLTMLLGGQVVYTGKDVHTAHAGTRDLGLNDAHFDAFLNHFRAALEEVGVKANDLEKVMTLLEGQRNAVVRR